MGNSTALVSQLSYMPTGISSISNTPNQCLYTMYPYTNFSSTSCSAGIPGATETDWICDFQVINFVSLRHILCAFSD